MKYTNYIPNIKAMLDARDVFQAYGVEVDRKGFASCPFHHEKTASCKVYKDGFKCFGCGEYGDVIDFVEKYFGISQFEACKKLNNDFHLGQPLDTEEYAFDKFRAQERRKLVSAKKAKMDKLYENYWKAFYTCMFYRDYVLTHKPKDDEEPTKEFLNALKNVGYSDYLLDVAEVELLNAFVT